MHFPSLPVAVTPVVRRTPSAAGLWDDLSRATSASAEVAPCGRSDVTACGLLRQAGLSEPWARTIAAGTDTALRIVLVLAVAVALRWVAARAITRLAERIATGGSAGTPASGGAGGTLAGERRTQRARTLGSVLSSLTTAVVWVTAGLLVLGEVGIDLAPLLAGAGVVGVAVGFGSQALVKDFLSGIFLIAEDQYGVGDVVDLSGAKGTVEAVGLRVTRLRSVDGTVWYLRNGEVLRVGNSSQGWARAVVDVDVAFSEDVEQVQRVLADVASGLAADPEWAPAVLEEPQVWGVEALTAERVVVRVVVRTVPDERSGVSRELRRRIKLAFDAAGIGAVAGPPDAPPAPPPRLPVPSQGLPRRG